MPSPKPGGSNPRKGPMLPKTPPAPHGDPKVKDDRVLRTMPITQNQLRQIKKHYGIN